MKDWDLIVVGGGWAGCSAAYHAARRGQRVLLLEAGPRLGGRASSFAHAASGAELDNGQHLFLGAYRETQAMLERLGSWIQFQPSLEVPFIDNGKVHSLRAARLPGPLALGLGLLSFDYLSWREKRQALSLGLWAGIDLLRSAFGRPPVRLEKISVAQWLSASGQGPALISKLWEPMCLAALNAYPQQARAAEFATVLARGFLRGGRSASLGFSPIPLGRLLLPSLKLFVEHRQGEIRQLCAATSIQISDGRFVSVSTSAGVERGRACVLALPRPNLDKLVGAQLASALGLDAIPPLPSSPIVSVTLWLDRQVMPVAFAALSEGGVASGPFHWIFQQALPEGSAHPWRVCVVASAADSLAGLSGEQALDTLLGQLTTSLPAFDPAWIKDKLVLREQSATPLFAPGCHRLGQRTPVLGLSLAGDHSDTCLPATIEGAVLSGRLALDALRL